jgi:polar amino acid transport system substrate-binding protein
VNRLVLGLAALAATSVALAGCGSSSSGGDNPTVTPSSPSQSSAAPGASPSVAPAGLIPGCTPSTMKTVSAGTLTIGADKPVYPPWFIGNDPTNGKGFEGAIDFAIAKELGYTPAQITIDLVTFNQAIGPAARNFDFDLDEFSITAAREKAVDFSAPYYDVNEAVVAMKGSKGAAVTSLAGLKTLKLGAQIGTTNETTITDTIKPSQSPAIYNSNAVAIQALKNGQIDGLVLDLPTAFYVTSAQVSGSVIVGQLPATGKPEQFGALLPKNSPLTSCVSKAINALKANGTLAKIQAKWLAKAGKAPVLQ